MQTLKIFQSLWAMEQRHPILEEPSNDAKFEKIKSAGFNGVCIDLAAHEVEEFKKTQPLFKHHKLECMVNAFPYALDDLKPVLQLPRILMLVLSTSSGE